jgi:UDP-4-amino-4-deoxy-L-arabinose-oxoglutarate aminotransferase
MLADEDRRAVLAALDSGMIAEGEETARLEADFRQRLGLASAVAVGSGSQALLLALRAVGVRPGSEVVLPSLLCPEVLAVVDEIGAQPILVDVREDGGISQREVRRAVTERTAAIVAAHLMGIWCDLSELRDLGVPLIEDCAQFVHGPALPNACVVGDAVVYSFHATKLLTAGEGGLVACGTGPIAERLESLKRFGTTSHKNNLFPLSDLQAALARAQLARLDAFLERRRSLAELYSKELVSLPNIDLPWRWRDRSIFFRFPIRLSLPLDVPLESWFAAFAARGVAVRRPVDALLHRLCPDRASGSYPVAEDFYARTISLPLHPSLTEAECRTVLRAAHDVLGEARTG